MADVKAEELVGALADTLAVNQIETLINIMVKFKSVALLDVLVDALADEHGSRHSGQ